MKIKIGNGDILMSKDRKVLLTHYDLDGVGCDILMSKMFKFEKKIQCGYAKIKEKLNNGDLMWYDSAIVTDVSLTADQYKKISDEYKEKFLYVDHHKPSVEMVHGLGSTPSKCVVSDKFSATGLTLQVFKGLHKQKGIFPFVSAIDAYDCWRCETHPATFDTGYDLNILFWKYGYFDFYDRFADSFSLTFDYDERKWIDAHKKERDSVIANADKTEFGNNSLLILDTPSDYVNDFTIQLPDYDVYYMVCVTHEGKLVLSMRSKMEGKSLGHIARDVKDLFQGDVVSAGGHPKSAGIDFCDKTPLDVILDVVEYVNGNMEGIETDAPYSDDIPF